MSSNVIQENYSNVLDYLAKTLSIFKCHVDYSQKLTEDCNSLFQLGKLLHKDYEKLLESTDTREISVDLDEQDPIMISFEKLMEDTPIDALYNLWPVQTLENDQNSISQSIVETIIITTPEPEIKQPYRLLSKRTNNNNRRIKKYHPKVKKEQLEMSQPAKSQQTHKCSVCSKEFGYKHMLTRHMRVHSLN